MAVWNKFLRSTFYVYHVCSFDRLSIFLCRATMFSMRGQSLVWNVFYTAMVSALPGLFIHVLYVKNLFLSAEFISRM